jgi:hypothetical protein
VHDSPVRMAVLEASERGVRKSGVIPSDQIQTAIWVVRVIGILLAIGWTVWSGFRPAPSDSRKWYDRAIRAVGE